MGILDSFDDPNFLASVLGAGGALNLNSLPSGGSGGGQPAGPPIPPGGISANVPLPQSAPGMYGANPPMPMARPAVAPQGGPPQMAAQPPIQNTGGMPWMQTPGSAYAPGAIPPPAPGNVSPNMGVGGPPPPPAPGVPPGGAIPGQTQGGSLARALGIMPPGYSYPYPQRPSPVQNFMGALGQGLSTVGGNTAGGAFARGMGGALKGGIATNNQQEAEQLRRQQNFFNETISADNQLMKGVAFPYQIRHVMAATDLMQGRAGAVVSGAPRGSQWYGSDIDRLYKADREADNEYKQRKADLRSDATSGLMSPEDAQAANKQLEANRDQMRQVWYTKYRVDPNKTQGTQKNPIDVSKMSPVQVEQMPEGTFIKWVDKDGKTQVAPRDYAVRPNRYQQQPQASNPGVDAAVTQSALQPTNGPQ